MIELLKTSEVTEDGIEYVINEYENGTIEKYVKAIPQAEIIEEVKELTLAQMQEQILLNTEYLVAMQELNLN